MGAAALGLLEDLAAGLSGPLALLGGVLIPTNDSLMAAGTLPDHPDIRYRYDEGALTLIQTDRDGNPRLLFSGLPEMTAEGLYRTRDGVVIGCQIGNSFMLSDAGLSSIRADDADNRSVAQGATTVATTPDEPKLCPDPSPDRPGNKSPRAIAYQAQITGLPPGMAVMLNGVSFDGCRTTDGTMLEAKGPGIAQHINNDLTWKPYIIKRGQDELDKQIKRQSEAAGNRTVEWHFAEPRLAAYAQKFISENHYKNITVIITPPRMP